MGNYAHQICCSTKKFNVLRSQIIYSKKQKTHIKSQKDCQRYCLPIKH